MTESGFDELLANARELSRKGEYTLAAGTYLDAASQTTSLPQRANALHRAARCYGLDGKPEERLRHSIDSAQAWTSAALAENLSTDLVLEYRWEALSASITSRDVHAQTGYAIEFASAVGGKGFTSGDLAEMIARRIRALPPITSRAVRQILIRCEAQLREAATDTLDPLSKERELARVLRFYQEADDRQGVDRVRAGLTRISFDKGSAREHEGAGTDGLMAQARMLDAAAVLYGSACPDDAARCQKAAKARRARVDALAITVPGYLEAMTTIKSSLRAFDADNDARASQNIRLQPLSSLARSKFADQWNDEVYVARRVSHGLQVDGDSYEQFVDAVAATLGLDIGIPTVRYCLSRILSIVGESTEYCPAPTGMPLWIITTTWRKTLTAAICAAVAGGATGLTASGDPKGLIAGVVGTECGLLVNLLSTYLTQARRDGKLIELIKRYEPKHGLLLLCLTQNDMTQEQLAAATGLPSGKVRKMLKLLEEDGVVTRAPKSRAGKRPWRLKDTG